MKTAGVVLDFYDDLSGSLLKRAFPTPDELPEQVKVAHVLSPEERDVLRDEAYALVMSNEGKILRKFACVDAGNTLLSCLYFEANAHLLPEEAVKTAAANLESFCHEFDFEPTNFVKMAAANHYRQRDPARQPLVGDEADWAARTNLVSIRGGADSGRVIPAANQMKTAGVEGGGETLTDDKRNASPKTKMPELQKKTEGKKKESGLITIYFTKGSPKNPPKGEVVDVSGTAPKPTFEKKSSARHALNDRYPLDDYADVKAAVTFFNENWKSLDPSDRHEFAVKTAARAEELDITVSEELGRYGSTGYAPDLEAHIAQRKLHAPDEYKGTYDELKEKVSSVQPDEFVQMLSQVDEAAGLNWYYGGDITDPYMATFGGKEKSAQADWTWENNPNVTAESLKAVAGSEEFKNAFDESLTEGFAKDPVGIFESLPMDTKKIIAGMATSED